MLNTNCSKAGGCGLGSPQEKWLKADLAANPTACTVAYWHRPRYSSGYSGSSFVSAQSALWQDLYNAGTDLVLNGHDHDYERFAPMNEKSGSTDPTHGIREIIVGTGVRNHTKFSSTILSTSQVRDATSYGALKLTLRSSSYSWQFIPISGQTFTDFGSEALPLAPASRFATASATAVGCVKAR